MEGVIFIRTLTEGQERTLEEFKSKKGISANTKAIQRIIEEYERLLTQEERLNKEVRVLRESRQELEDEVEEYKRFFKMMNKFLSVKKKNKSNDNG